jgi:hypothetical protein
LFDTPPVARRIKDVESPCPGILSLGGRVMHIHSLGPHTYFTPSAHERRHDWLTRFKARERRALIEEDCQARSAVAMVIGGAMLFGLALLLAALMLAL